MSGIDPALQRFWPRLQAAAARVLVLDYDGTLAPFTPDRDAARPYPAVEEALAAVLDTAGQTRVVFVTGRSAAVLMRLMPLAARCEIWGSHGLERRRPSGATGLPDIGAAPARRLAQAKRAGARAGLAAHIEEKPGCVALHWRGLPPPEAQRAQAALTPAWARLAGAGLQLREFDGGIELRSTLATKARAVEWVKREAGPDAVLAFLGDDLTDEDGFRVLGANDLRVLVRPEYRPTLADVWLRPPDELLAFLQKWRKILE
jgi:trehalose-phosphatase